jgi:hypothetical protein
MVIACERTTTAQSGSRRISKAGPYHSTPDARENFRFDQRNLLFRRYHCEALPRDGGVAWRKKLPAIPNTHPPNNYNQAFHLDYGPNWQQTRILSIQPPTVGAPFPILVPQVDADGTDRAGIHLPEITVPLATYTGWNLRDPATGAPEERVSFLGSYIPFAKTAADRKASGDPRLSIEERYPSRADYLTRYNQAVDDLVHQRWILPDDAAALKEQGAKEWDYATK